MFKKSSIYESFLKETPYLFLMTPVLIGLGAYTYLTHFFAIFSNIPYFLTLIFLILIFLLKNRPYLNLINIFFFCLLLGFSSASLETQRYNHSFLHGENVKAYIEGKVVNIIYKPTKTNIVIELNNDALKNTIGEKALANVNKVYVKITSKSEVPKKGDVVYLKAMLNPPTPKIMKGSFDFQKYAYFQSIGAYGYAISKLYFLERSPISSVNKFRNSFRKSIEEHSSNKSNSSLIKSLALGEKKSIPEETLLNFRASGISHLLSISGLHIGLIFGFIFLFIRYLLALNQTLSLRINTKKISAFIAIFTTLFYVILVGAPIPTIRAFIMTFIVFLGIIFNRQAISMRTVAIAGILILLLMPHSILSASFQMSFSAVIALVAAYEYITSKNIMLTGFKGYFIGIILTSIIAIIATTPFAIYNFQNFSTYGVLTNVLVIPIISFLIIPLIILSYLLFPLSISFPLVLIDKCISYISNVAEYVASLPYSYILVATFTVLSLGLFIFGGLFTCIFKHGLQKIGLILLICFLITSVLCKDKPDIIVLPQASLIVVRNSDGLLTFSNDNNSFAMDIITKINGQKAPLYFQDNSLLNEYKFNKDGKIININHLNKELNVTQQIYVKKGKIKTILVR